MLRLAHDLGEQPGFAHELRCPVNQRRKQIRLVAGDYPLQHRRNPLQPHARINRRLGQGIQLPAHIAVELHEHQIPDLDIAPAIAAKRAIRVPLIRSNRAHVIVNLAARAAGPGVAHLPEIVLQPHFKDAILRHALPNP